MRIRRTAKVDYSNLNKSLWLWTDSVEIEKHTLDVDSRYPSNNDEAK
jgi:hypothetical protein